MKTNLWLLGALIAAGHPAFAQSSSSSVDAAAAAPSSITSDQSSASSNAGLNVKPKVTYLGVMYGPGLEFKGTEPAGAFQTADSGANFWVDNRPKLIFQTSNNFNFGYEARVNTIFKADGMLARNGNHRLLASFKNVYKDEVFAVTITPRVVLPTSQSAHNQHMLPSPELLASLDVSPKNSRFTSNLGIQYIYGIFGTDRKGTGVNPDNQNKDNYTKAVTGILAPWLEVDYQLSAKTQLMVSYWPELVAFARQNAPLATDSNEVDVGAYYEFAKGWQLNPFVATQMLGIDTAHMDKGMSLNLALTGTLL